ncbi:unnamed protein product [Orchesella dallaii]|uniref:MADF domain-containing protein n=1 Tax=Orchesella dallaii TaxID=48710 RepID=A0ABP1Q5A7_9HEXA
MDRSKEEALIEFVRDRSYLYDKRDPSYKDTIKTKNAFAEAGRVLGIGTAQETEHQWKELRKQYTNYLRKLTKPSGSGARSQPSFRHASTMEFYQHFYKPYKTFSNVIECEDEDRDENTFNSNSSLIDDPGEESGIEGQETPSDKPQNDETPKIPPKSRFQNKRKCESSELDEKLIKALDSTHSIGDEFDHFGANIAIRLRKLQTYDARLTSRAQFELQSVLHNFEEFYYNLSNPFIPPQAAYSAPSNSAPSNSAPSNSPPSNSTSANDSVNI